jgi:hypothetical protein
MLTYGNFDSLEGNFDGSLMDCICFLITNYTTVGYGDIESFDHFCFAAGMEAITGFLLIT